MLQLNFSPFPELETERLLLRRLVPADAAQVFKLRSDPKTMQYIPRPLVKNTEEALEHIALIESRIQSNEGINWAITLKSNPDLLGIIGHYRIQFEHYRAEIGYMLLPEAAGKGIATEAIQKVVQFGFAQMGLHSIEAVIDPANIASEKVLLKNGFVKEAHFKENEFFDGKFIDSAVYSLLQKA